MPLQLPRQQIGLLKQSERQAMTNQKTRKNASGRKVVDQECQTEEILLNQLLMDLLAKRLQVNE